MKSVVIGSGFGGIAAALRLKAKNHNVTLIEKHPDLGGRARVFKKNGFTFDGGPTKKIINETATQNVASIAIVLLLISHRKILNYCRDTTIIYISTDQFLN